MLKPGGNQRFFFFRATFQKPDVTVYREKIEPEVAAAVEELCVCVANNINIFFQ